MANVTTPKRSAAEIAARNARKPTPDKVIRDQQRQSRDEEAKRRQSH